MRYALGIDLGGTKILAGVIDLERGKVVATAKRKSKVEQGPDELQKGLVEVVQEAVESVSDHRVVLETTRERLPDRHWRTPPTAYRRS